jgi:hypothetical protein
MGGHSMDGMAILVDMDGAAIQRKFVPAGSLGKVPRLNMLNITCTG